MGLRSLKRRAQEIGLPLPRYTWNDPYLILTLYRSPASAAASLPAELRDTMTEAELRGWQWLSNTGRTKAGEYANALGVENRTARRHLNRFVALGLVRRTGSARLTVYEVV